MIKFGTDGWRAVIAQDFTFDNVARVSQAVADYLAKKKKGKKRVVIGYDCRFLSAEFASTVASCLAGNGIVAVLSDRPIPTPTVSYHCRYYKYDLGVMLTASHNPAQFNGFKIKTPEGGSAEKSLTNAVEALLNKRKPKLIDIDVAKGKKLVQIKDLTPPYIAFLRKYVNVAKIKKLRLKVLVDVMFGSGDHYVEKILGKHSLKIDYIHDNINPSFEGIHPEPVEKNLQELMRKVKEGKYDMGISLDGDADRIAMVDNKGNYINAQILVPLLGIHMIKNRKASGGIGKTIVGSNVIDDVACSLGVACYETPVGFKYLSHLFKQNVIAMGGEEAGGIGFKGYIPERDGSVAFLLVLEMIAVEKKKFGQLLKEFFNQYGRWYYSRVSIPIKSVKKGLEDLKLPEKINGKKVERVNALDGIKLITKDTWLMFRKSGTEPIVRVYAEAKTQKEADKLLALGKKMIYAL